MALTAPILLTLVRHHAGGYAFMVQHAVQNAASKRRAAILPNRSNTIVIAAVNSTLQPMGMDTTRRHDQVNNVT